MADSDRGNDNEPWWVISGLVLLIATLVVVLGIVTWTNSNYRDESQQNTREIQSYAERYVRERCVGLDVATGVKCITDARKAASDQERDEADLYAQRQMAIWAFAVAVAGFVSIPLSIAGIFFVRSTLAEMREQRSISQGALSAANEANAQALRAADYAKGMLDEAKTATLAAVDGATAAKKSAKFQEESSRCLERPYLFIVLVNTKPLRRPGNDIANLKYTFANYGKTPAILRHLFIELRQFSEIQLLDDGRPRISMNAGEDWYDIIAAGDKLSGEPRQINVTGASVSESWEGERGKLLALHARVSYDDPAGSRYDDHFLMMGNKGAESFQLKWRKQTKSE